MNAIALIFLFVSLIAMGTQAYLVYVYTPNLPCVTQEECAALEENYKLPIPPWLTRFISLENLLPFNVLAFIGALISYLNDKNGLSIIFSCLTVALMAVIIFFLFQELSVSSLREIIE
ncbi:hypothetical protein C4553_02875 [Candidatus Parcubacteria bacterium]|nr:MAG: hypothetical protein C4553_02875 [Candidatus Parcubacteria bacterium]